MSKTPIFDAVLADSDPDIFLAGLVFARPAMETLQESLTRIGHPRFQMPWYSLPSPSDPANLSFLGSVA